MVSLFVLLVMAAVCYAVPDVPVVRQRFADSHNDRVVAQIQRELSASYLYQAYSHYFARADVALPGFQKFFDDMSKEERGHAEELMEYINKRGGTNDFHDITFEPICNAISQQLSTGWTDEFDRRATPCICHFMRNVERTGDCKPRDQWKNGLYAMEDALVLERYVNQHILDLHKYCESDPHLSHILEHHFLDEQVESIKKMADYVRQLRRVGDGLGEYMFDKSLQ